MSARTVRRAATAVRGHWMEARNSGGAARRDRRRQAEQTGGVRPEDELRETSHSPERPGRAWTVKGSGIRLIPYTIHTPRRYISSRRFCNSLSCNKRPMGVEPTSPAWKTWIMHALGLSMLCSIRTCAVLSICCVRQFGPCFADSIHHSVHQGPVVSLPNIFPPAPSFC